MELFIVLYVLLGGYLIWCFCEIAAKAGYSRWFGLLMIVPVVNLIILGIFVHETWPILKTKEQIRTEKIDKLQVELSELRGQQDVPDRLTGKGKRGRATAEAEKLGRIRQYPEQVAEIKEKSTQQEERETLKYTPGKCPYCSSTSVSEHIIEGPLSESDMKDYGYYYKWDFKCSECGKEWFGIE